MTKKSLIGTIIYFIFVIILVFLVSVYSAAANAHGFLSSFQEEIEDNYNIDNNLVLISAATIADSRNNLETYIRREPILQVQNEFGRFYFYSLVQFNQNISNNMLAFIIRDINIAPMEDEREIPISNIHVRINFDQQIQAGMTNTRASLAPVFDGPIGLRILNYDLLTTTGGRRVEFTSLVIEYEDLPTGSNQGFPIPLTTMLSLNQEQLELFNESNLNLLKQYNSTNFLNGVDNGTLYFQSSLTETFSNFNPIVSYMLITASFLIVVTYLIFFLKPTMILIRNKKAKKQIIINKKRKEIEETEQKNNDKEE